MSDHGTQDEGEQDDPVTLAHAFATSRFGAELGGDPVPFRVGETAADIEARLPAQGYAFITAWNPEAEAQPIDENARDDDALVARLEAWGAQYRRTWAQDAQGGHREAGWLIAGIDAARADALGREFGQAGILAWNAGEPVRLHMLMPCPPGGADLPHVDWIE